METGYLGIIGYRDLIAVAGVWTEGRTKESVTCVVHISNFQTCQCTAVWEVRITERYSGKMKLETILKNNWKMGNFSCKVLILAAVLNRVMWEL